MTVTGFRSSNHPQQVAARGPIEDVDDRRTRDEYWLPWHDRYRFTLDAAASVENAKLPRFYTREQDGLKQSWATERIWCNPPYSDCGSWVRKAWFEFNGRLRRPADLIVMLLPANRTEQRWWQEQVEPWRDRPGKPLTVEFLPGRMRFDRPGVVIGPKGDRPPFGCCLLTWSRGDVP